MITPKQIFEMSNFGTSDIIKTLQESGYSGDGIFDLDFNGLTDSNQFEYTIFFHEDDGRVESGFVYVSVNPETGAYTAEF